MLALLAIALICNADVSVPRPGWTNRQQFEESWMSLLGVLNPVSHAGQPLSSEVKPSELFTFSTLLTHPYSAYMTAIEYLD